MEFIMKATKVKEGIYWVGAVDWDIRNFHGYSTEEGTSYGAYLIVDEKITLIDTVKAPFADEMILLYPIMWKWTIPVPFPLF